MAYQFLTFLANAKTFLNSIYFSIAHRSKAKLCLSILSITLRLGIVIAICLNVYLNLAYPLATFEEINFVLNSPTGQLNYQHIRPILFFFIIPFIIIYTVLIISNKKLHHRLTRYIQTTILLIVLSAISFYSNYHYNFYESIITASTESDFIKNYYQDPKTVKITPPEHKKNLIHIYLESMEMTFASHEFGGAKKDNIIPELTELALQKDSDCFSDDPTKLNGATALFGSTWTMGSVFSHESGLPLKTSGIGGNDMGVIDDFFNTTLMLSDILKEAGYLNVVLRGSDTSFANARAFYSVHNYDRIMDYPYFQKSKLIPEDYCVWWGIEDSKLLEFCKKQLMQLSSNNSPFNLTIVTADTHFEDGYICPLCDNQFEDQYSNVIHCSSRQIAEFVTWCKQQDFYKDTVIVITGDHPTMDSDFCDDVDKQYERKTFVTIINADKHSHKTKAYSTFDLFPTILSSLGFSIDGNRLGLGTDLYSDTPTLLETYNMDELNNELAKHSLFMDELSSTISLSYFDKNYSDINDFLFDLIKESKQRDLMVMITSYGDYDKILNTDSLELLNQLNLKTLKDVSLNKDGFYIGIIHCGKTYEEFSKSNIYYHDKFDGIRVLMACGIYDNKKRNFAGLFDKTSSMIPADDGINIAVYDLGLNFFAKGITFPPK